MSSSTTTPLSLADQLREEGRRRGLSPDQIEAALVKAGYAQPSSGGGFGHAAGVAARGLVQGAGDLVGLPFGMAGQAYQAATGNAPPAMLQPQGAAVANQMGLPQPASGGERMAMAAGENGLMAAAFPGAGAGSIALGAGAGLASQGAAEAGAGPMGQLAAGAAVGMGIPVVGALGAGAIRAAIAGAASSRQAAQQSAALLRAGDPNAAMSLGQVAQGGVGRILNAGFKNVPGASEVFRDNAAAQAQGMGQRAAGIADEFSTVGTPMLAGAAVQKGITEGYIPRFRAVANKLYEKAFSYVPADTPVIPSSTIRLFADMNEIGSAAGPLRRQLENGKVAAIGEDLAKALDDSPGGIQFGTLKELRSRIGSILSGEDQVSDINLRDVKRLYGALSDDMREAIAKVDGVSPEDLSSMTPGGRLGAFDAGVRAENARLAASGVLPRKVAEILGKTDNLGFSSAKEAANAILGDNRPGGWSRYWDVSDLPPDQVAVIDQWRAATIGGKGTPRPAGGAGSALAAWDKAESFWKQGMDRIENTLQPLIDKKQPERAFQAIMSGTRDGATILQGTMRSLGPDQQNIIRATVIRRMGSANPGMQNAAGDMFSPETFLTNWNKVGPEAKGALFDGADPRVVGNLNSLAKAIEIRKKAGGVLPNPSGTAQNTAFWSVLAGLSTAVGGLATGSPRLAVAGMAPAVAAGGANLTARMFTNPRMIDWLVKQTRVPFGAMAQQLALLAKDSQKWPTEDQDIAQQVTSTLGNVDWPSVLLASAVVDQAH